MGIAGRGRADNPLDFPTVVGYCLGMPATATLTRTECIHGIDDPMWCTPCRDANGYQSGIDRHRNDCTVMTVATLTGADYDEALSLLADAGRRPGHGATAEQVHAALRTAGWTVTASRLTLEQAVRSGRTYHVSARRGTRGHSFAITAGAVINDLGWMTASIRYRIWEVQ